MTRTNFERSRLLAFVAIVVLFGTSCGFTFTRSPEYSATAGYADLRSVDFSQGPIRVGGDYAFLWNRSSLADLENDSPEELAAYPVAPVPGIWNDRETPGHPEERLGPNGHAVYALVVDLPASDQAFAVRTVNVATACEVWINGERAGSSGIFSTVASSIVASAEPMIASFLPRPGRNVILFRVANSVHLKGGLWSPVFLGRQTDLERIRDTGTNLEFAVAGALLFMAFYNLFLYLFRRRERLYLFFGLTILLCVVGQIVRGEYIVYALFPGIDYVLLKKLQFAPYILSAGLFGYIFLWLFPDKTPRRFVLAHLAFTGVVACAIAVLPFRAAYWVASVFYPITGVFFLFLLALAVVLAARRQVHALPIAFSLVVLCAGFGHDVLFTLEILVDGYWMPYAVFFFLAMYTLTLARRFTQNSVHTEQLTVELNARAEDLEKQVRIEKHLEAENLRLYESVRENLKRQIELTDAYSRFVPQEYLERLEKVSVVDLKLGDQTSESMTVMFADIRGFTTLAERRSPQEIFDFINDYLHHVLPPVKLNQGFVDNFFGDGFLALFPIRPEDALLAAVEIQKALGGFNAGRTAQGLESVAAGIGIHTGQLILGTIGEKDRMGLTVISDDVNLASRIEGLTRFYDAGILISSTVFAQLDDPTKYNFRFLDRVKVKGKSREVGIFEILDGIDEKEFEVKLKKKDLFENGVILFQQRKFREAYGIFREINQFSRKDRAAQIYQKRCYNLVKYGAPPDWDGVVVYTRK